MRHATTNPGPRPWLIALVALVALAATGRPSLAQDPPDPEPITLTPVALKTYSFDLGELKLPTGSSEELLASLGMKFPMRFKKKGSEVELDNPKLRQVAGPPPAVILCADVRYRKTSGFPQLSTRGYIELMSPIAACLTISEGDEPEVVKAELCFTKITVRKLRLKGIPRWLTESDMVIDKLEGKIGGEKRYDFTAAVRKHLHDGGTLVDAGGMAIAATR